MLGKGKNQEGKLTVYMLQTGNGISFPLTLCFTEFSHMVTTFLQRNLENTTFLVSQWCREHTALLLPQCDNNMIIKANIYIALTMCQTLVLLLYIL